MSSSAMKLPKHLLTPLISMLIVKPTPVKGRCEKRTDRDDATAPPHDRLFANY
jgi:hypothetical protein